MKKISFSIFQITVIALFAVLLILAAAPFRLVDMKQAERIAKWKTVFEEMNYCFSLADTFEGSIAEESGYDAPIAEELLISKLKPYFDFEDEQPQILNKYKYRKKNGRFISKHSRFYFDKFLKRKDGSLVSFRKNLKYTGGKNQPLYFMYIDINGENKPNMAGGDIFFAEIFPHKIEALGYNKEHSKLKQNCSPVGSGLYCSEFYLSSGHF